MNYVEGFVTPIPSTGERAFTDHARRAAALLGELGAERVVDAWGDDVPRGEVNDFAGAVRLTEDETVGFGWMEFADRAARDAFTERMMRDPRMAELGDMPFDGKRMIFGGFRVIVDDGPGGAAGYVDGFVLPVSGGDEAAYREAVAPASAVLRENGATRYVAAWGDDVPAGEVTDFHRAAHVRDGEVVVFSWCEWPDKATRDVAMACVLRDERVTRMGETVPFDGRRVVFGGFRMLSDARAGSAGGAAA